MKLNIEIKTKEQRDQLLKQLKEMEFKKPLPSSWEELSGNGGYRIMPSYSFNDSSGIHYSQTAVCDLTFATKKQAKSTLAKAQLSQLMKVYNDGWEPDWENVSQSKYVIYSNACKLQTGVRYTIYNFLTFKNKDTTELFLKNFEPLIKQYFELD